MTSFISVLRTMKAYSWMCATHTHDELSPFSYVGSMGKKTQKTFCVYGGPGNRKAGKLSQHLKLKFGVYGMTDAMTGGHWF